MTEYPSFHGIRRLLVAAVMLASAGNVFAIACGEVFSNAVGTTGGELKLDNQPRLVNTGAGILATDDLTASGRNANRICDGAACMASGTPIGAPPLPANASGTDYESSPLAFSAGDYYYADFTLSGGQAVNLVVTGGTVRIHVAGKLVIDNAKANSAGAPEDLVFLVAGDVDIKGKAKVNAMIYSEGAVVITDNATQVEGAVTGFSVEVKDKARVTFDVDAVAAADFGAFCAGSTSTAADAAGFNCVEVGNDPLGGRLFLKRVGDVFAFDVVALSDTDSDGVTDGIETAFAADSDRAVDVEIVDASTGGACASLPAVSPAVSQLLTFSAADNGRKATALMAINKAYPSLACRVTDNSVSPALVACSTDVFAIRPIELTLSAPGLGNAGPTGGPRAVAGSTFTLSASGGAGYTGTPAIDNSKIEPHAGAVAPGLLSGSFPAASGGAGTATGPGFSYSEVGNFRLSPQGVYDDTFAAVDLLAGDCTDDFSNTPVAGKYGCKFGNVITTDWVGRFYPAQFTVSVQDDGALSPNCASSFSYQGEEVLLSIPVVFRATAQNAAGAVTQNYTGAYAKLTSADFGFLPVTGDGSQVGADGVTPVSLSWTTGGALLLTDNVDGSHDLKLSGSGFTWGRLPNDLVAAFTTDLGLAINSVVDADGVNGSGLPVSAGPSGVDMRYGRLAIGHAHGSELQHLPVPMRVEHYLGTGGGFVTNVADSCSQLVSIGLSDLNVGDALQVSETCIWDDDNDSGLGCSGVEPAGMEYEPAATAGSFSLHLRAPGAGNAGVLSVNPVAPAHLQFDWLGTGDTNPTARATFGIFNRPSSVIFRRELR